MPDREPFIFKSKAQAEKVKSQFLSRYGDVEGEKLYNKIASRSPKMEDLPDKMDTSFHHEKKRKISVTRRFGRQWRGV